MFEICPLLLASLTSICQYLLLAYEVEKKVTSTRRSFFVYSCNSIRILVGYCVAFAVVHTKSKFFVSLEYNNKWCRPFSLRGLGNTYWRLFCAHHNAFSFLECIILWACPVWSQMCFCCIEIKQLNAVLFQCIATKMVVPYVLKLR